MVAPFEDGGVLIYIFGCTFMGGHPMKKSWEKMTADEKADQLRAELIELNRKVGLAMGHAEEAHIKLREIEKKMK
jgi:hypothetical protein